MKLGSKILSILFVVLLLITINYTTAIASENQYGNDFLGPEAITAVNDTFYFTSGCGNLSFSGNVISNDIVPAGMKAKIQHVTSSMNHIVSFGENGNFAFQSEIGFTGIASFTYNIWDENEKAPTTEATVYIKIASDNDCDGIFDVDDLDDDNDGIPDMVEGNGRIDTDMDGIPDSYDIDSDNDGITDTREWQDEKNYILPTGNDENANGWDDAFEAVINPYKFEAVDSDNDMIPDFLDDDSDNDNITDYVEATDSNFDSFPDLNFLYSDIDFDGLDDAFDNVRLWQKNYNSIGSIAPIPDHNNNGVADFRENMNSLDYEKREISILEYNTAKITFPNPTQGRFSISIQDFDSNENTHIRIYGLNGDVKADIVATQSIIDMDLTSYNSGVYVIKIITPNLTCAKKLVLQN